jgi:hypothetical protein
VIEVFAGEPGGVGRIVEEHDTHLRGRVAFKALDQLAQLVFLCRTEEMR